MEPIGGLHHVTAVTGRVAGNFAFYQGVLGMRLVKKTVNQDDTEAYHLFYADEQGRPGTELTFFDWPHAGPVQAGAGTVVETALRVTGGRAALEHWWQRLGQRAGGIEEGADGSASLAFADPEGQRLRLVAPAELAHDPAAVVGLDSVTLAARHAEPTMSVLTDVLNLQPAGEDERGQRFQIGADGSEPARAGQQIRLLVQKDAPWGRVGIGGVHHVAFRVSDAAAQLAWRNRLVDAGLPVSEVIDRFYFRAIYFREPGGLLFEISTNGPGFAADEDPAHLGEKLSLPPFLEGQRAEIEARLTPLRTAGPAL